MQYKKLAVIVLAVMIWQAGCKSQNSTSNQQPSQELDKDTLQLVFTYGSEKEKWIKDVTDAFNAQDKKISNGKIIRVQAIPLGSGELIDELLSGRRQAHLTSPASAAFLKLGNAQSRAKTGKDLVLSTENLVISPVVIAMWKPMAQAIGWGKKAIGWSEILQLARDPRGWESYGHPEWGKFKFGHTHPEYSNSGLISLLAEVYAASGKSAGLKLSDVENTTTGEFVGDIEKSIVHYGSSTGFFGRKLFENGPEYLSAAVLYENMVIESYSPEYRLPFPVVAIYPKEGTFWSDHPAGIVEREWVTKDHREAAKIYLSYLLEQPQQQKALQYGFRPGSLEVPLSSPLDVNHGIDPKEPKTTLEVPAPEIMNQIIKVWYQYKKHSDVVLVFDRSGSMKDGQKMEYARPGSLQLLSMLSDEDYFSLLPFNNIPVWSAQGLQVKTGRQSAQQVLENLFPEGGTALYDAINTGYQYLAQNPKPDKISAVVVLTDGKDTDSRLSFEQLKSRIRFDNEKRTIRIFTIGYGSDAEKDVLKAIADAAQGRFYEGKPENIRTVFQEISTFF